jgi:hypothetical protein
MSLRAISAALAAQGHFTERGAPFNPYSIKSMLEGASLFASPSALRPSDLVARR